GVWPSTGSAPMAVGTLTPSDCTSRVLQMRRRTVCWGISSPLAVKARAIATSAIAIIRGKIKDGVFGRDKTKGRGREIKSLSHRGTGPKRPVPFRRSIMDKAAASKVMVVYDACVAGVCVRTMQLIGRLNLES